MVQRDLGLVRDFYLSRRLVFLGAPYVGKKTQSVRVADALGLPRIETSDLITAAEQDPDNPYHFAALSQKRSRDGGVMNADDMVNGLILREFGRLSADPKRPLPSGVVCDGSDRSQEQVFFLEKLRTEYHLPRTVWIYLSARRHVLEGRHQKRMIEAPRSDDGARKNRLDTFERITRAVIEWIRSSGFGYFIEINAEASEETVSSLVDLFLTELPRQPDRLPAGMRAWRSSGVALGR